MRYGIGAQQLTQERLKERVHYDPETGVMTLKMRPVKGGRTPIGAPMGSPHNAGYLSVNFDGKQYLVHRLAWFYVYGEWPNNIDHINHDRTDNRIANMRSVTRTENQRNQKNRKDSLSGVTGVTWCAKKNRWRVGIKADYKQVNLGSFIDFFEAVCARKSAETQHEFHANHGRAA